MALKPLYEAVVKESTNLQEDGAGKDDEEDEILQKKLPDVLNHWKNVFDNVEKYNTQLRHVLPTEANYHFTLLKFLPWLDETENKLKEIKRDAARTDHDVKLSTRIDDLKREIENNEPIHRDYNNSATNLLTRCDEVEVTADVPYIKDEVQHTNDRWDSLKAGLDETNKNAEELSQAMKDFEAARQPVDECIEAITANLDNEVPIDLDSESLDFYVQEREADLELMQEKEPELKDALKRCDDMADLIERNGGDPTDAKQKGNDLSDKWNGTKDKLTERRDDSKTHLNQLEQFLEATDNLNTWLNVTTSTVTNMGPASATPEGVKKQLEQVDAIQEEISKQNVKLIKAEELGDWLCDENKDNPQFCANVNNKLNKIKTPLEELRAMLSARKARLHDTLVATQDFQVAFKDFSVELDKLTSRQNKQKPLSVNSKALKSQDDEQKAVEKEIEALKPTFEKLIETGDKIVKETEKSSERDTLEDNLKELRRKFDSIVKTSDGRRDKINKVFPLSEKYFNKEDDVCDWLDKYEKVLKDLNSVPVSVEDVERLEESMIKLEEEIVEEEPEYKECLQSFDDLKKLAVEENITQDVPETTNSMGDIIRRWDHLKKDHGNKKQRAQKFRILLTSYFETVEPLKDTLTQFEDALDKKPSHGTDTQKCQDELQRIDELLRKLDTHEQELKTVDKISADLVHLVDDEKGDAGPIEHQTKSVDARFQKIRDALTDRKKSLEKVSRVLLQFNGIVDDTDSWCIQADEDFKKLGPVSKDPEEAKKQIHKIDVSVLLYLSLVENFQLSS